MAQSPLPPAHQASCGVKRQVATCEHRWCPLIGPPSECVDPRYELAGVKRLGQVVVGTKSESLDTIPDRSGGGQHQHTAVHAIGHEPAADFIAMDLRNVAV